MGATNDQLTVSLCAAGLARLDFSSCWHGVSTGANLAPFFMLEFSIEDPCFLLNGRYRARTYDLSGVNRMLFQLS